MGISDIPGVGRQGVDGGGAFASTARTKTAISAYPDTAEVVEGIYQLVQSPVRGLRAERREVYREWFRQRCPGSAQTARAAQRHIPGGTQHELALSEPFPLQIVRADGAYLWDVDGNRYVDFLQAGGVMLLGNNPPAVRERVLEVLAECGPATGMLHRYEIELARLIGAHVPGVERFRMVGSGTEAVMAALRVARAFTGKAHVIKIGGAYHGWSDQMMVGLRLPGTGGWEATGVPAAAYALTHEAYPNDVDGLRDLLTRLRHEGGTAAVIHEPLGPEGGAHPIRFEYNHELRQLCDEFGALLIFDEAVTGFRLGLGGAQEFFGVRADLTVFGNIVAGGYAGGGGVGGRAEVMDRMAGGVTAVGRRAFVGGTLSATSLACVAGYHTLLELERTDAPAVAGRAGDRLRAGLERLITTHDVPYVAYNYGSIVHLHTSGVLHLNPDDPDFTTQLATRTELLAQMSMAFTAEGLITVAGSRLFTSLADTDQVVDEALTAFERVFAGIEHTPGIEGTPRDADGGRS